MAVTIYRRGRVYWVSICANARREFRSLGTRDRCVADTMRRKLQFEVRGRGCGEQATWDRLVGEITANLATEVKAATLARYSFVFRRFGRFLAESLIQNLTEITPAVISGYLADRLKHDVHPTRRARLSPEALRADLRVLRLAFRFAVARNYLASSPVLQRRLNSRVGNTQPFTDDEIRRMFADEHVAARPELRGVLLLFLRTGLRLGDVINFQKAWIQPDGERIIVPTRKRGSLVTMPLRPELRLAIEASLAAQNEAQRASPLLFPTATGRPVKNLYSYLGRLWRRCGIAGAHPHRFRDTFAVQLLAQGASTYDVAKLLGTTVAVAESHYSPYTLELRERAARLIGSLPSIVPETPGSALGA